MGKVSRASRYAALRQPLSRWPRLAIVLSSQVVEHENISICVIVGLGLICNGVFNRPHGPCVCRLGVQWQERLRDGLTITRGSTPRMSSKERPSRHRWFFYVSIDLKVWLQLHAATSPSQTELWEKVGPAHYNRSRNRNYSFCTWLVVVTTPDW